MREKKETSMEEDELKDLLASRAATYSMLSHLYRTEVDEAYYKELISQKYPTHSGSEKVDEGYKLICDYLEQPHPDVITDLAVDYTRTFIGGGVDGYSAAYPFESVYTSPKRLMMQDARDEILVIYRAAGIDKDPTWTEGEDHIALELEFMQILASRACEAISQGREDEAISALRQQKSFLEDHLLMWFPMMETDMQKFAKTDFYRGLALLTEGYLEVDKEVLNELLESAAEEEGEEEK